MTAPAARELIEAHPWATLVSAASTGIVASHYPVLLDPDADELVLLSHVGRTDGERHELGRHEVLVIFQGPHGYISPGWYGVPAAVPTWDFAAVHAYGVPEILSPDENLRVLSRLVDHFEDPLPNPFRLRDNAANAAYAERIVGGTTGFRLRVTRHVGREKLSQDKPPAVVARIIAALRAPGPYQNPVLADRIATARP